LQELTVVISATNAGRRMKGRGPKALIDIGNGETVISRQILMAEKAMPEAQVVVVVGYCADKVKKALPKHVIVIENENYLDTNVSRSLLMGISLCVSRRVMIICGDLVFGPDFLECVPCEGSAVIIDENRLHRSVEVGCNIDNDQVEHFAYGAWPKWAHAAILEGKELDLFKRVASLDRSCKWLCHEVLNSVLQKGGSLAAAYPETTSLIEVDSIQDVVRARNLCIKRRDC
jgi:hypothetical protein